MKKTGKSDHRVSERVADYRTRNQREGIKRVETTVLAEDMDLIKEVAKVLRAGGSLANELRTSIRAVLPTEQAQTSEELLAFFQATPLQEKDQHALDFERDQSTGRTADLE